MIFLNEDSKTILEKFLHPKIFESIKNESIKLDKLKKFYFIDLPLFFKFKHYPIDKVLVVYTPKNLQLERFIKRNGFTEEESIRRMNTQIDIKRLNATWVIDNSSSYKFLQKQYNLFLKKI
jgi:dephospho-CoA kinase